VNHWKRLACWLLFFGYPLLVWSQTGLTSLRGTVTDPSGAILAGAEVSLENAATGFHITHNTDRNGAYEFPQIPPGKYTITVTNAGFGKHVKTAELLVSQPATINFALSVQATLATVEVSDIAQTVNTTDATIGNAVSNSTIQALPMEGRNVPDLLSLQPGVVYLNDRVTNADQDSRSGAVSGARSDQSNITLDGIDNNDQRQGYAFQGVLRSTLDSVEEFRVTTTNSNADSGRSSGAQVTLVTKSGTNSFHGSLYEYNRNSLGHANDWFNKASQIGSGLPNKPGQLIRNTFGATFGGPIRRDRIFFFVNYEGQKTQENQQRNLTVPTASFKAGNVSYNCTGDPACPASGVQTLTQAQVASMDPNCTTTCPWGPGEDPNALATLNAYPDPNSPGGDGLNTGGFTWSAPDPARINTYIAKLDYQLTANQRLFVRGNLQGDRISQAPQFPGNPPNASVVRTTKGIAVGHTWAISSTLINNFRYGYIRQALNNAGAGNNSFSDFVGISPLTAENTTTLLNVPVHNFVDDFTWVKGKHTLQFGANYRLIHNNASSNSVSFSSATSGNANISQAAIAGTGQSFDPAAFGFAGVSGDFSTSYDNAITAIAGLLSTINVHNNYRVANATTAALLPTGSTIPRDFKANEFEWYVQDSWRVRPNLTVTIGVRHTLLQTPYEVHGQQVAPTVDLHQWFADRAIAAAQGLGNQPEFAFAPSGQSRGGKPYWSMNKLDFAPRFAVAYAPDSKTSIRAGLGMYHDHFGEGIVDGFSQFGSFGLTSTQAAPSNIFTPDDAPRYTARTDVPSLPGGPPPQTVTYPAFPPNDPNTDGFTFNSNGIEGRIKTPHSFAADFSIQRQVGKGWTFEAAYVGRFGRHLLQQRDLAAATNLVDPKSGMDYYTAARLMSQFALAHGEDGTATIDPIAYFEDLFPTAAAGGFSATQNIYTGSGGTDACPSGFRWANRPGREVGAPYRLGLLATTLANGGVSPVCAGLPAVPFWNPQFSSLFAWSSLGTSSYNAGQFMLRHPMSHGLQVDFSYTYSKSLDLGSDTERTNSQGTTSTTSAISQGQSTVLSYIANPWNPRLNRAPSDFDLRHVITANWVYELPFGKGKNFAGGAGTLLDAAIGGWQLSGLNRWTSGFPFSVIDNRGFTQNFLFNSNMVQTAPIKSGLFMINGAPYAFPDPSAVVAGVQITPGVAATLTPMRFAYPGEAGSRNNFRGQGYFGIDMGLAKSWKIRENMGLKFAWEVFNVTNSVRFDTNTNTSLDNGSDDGSFGLYRQTLTVSRVQQFSLRFSF
jgi:Carboxypeptidase regulatory-like domain